MYSACCIFFSAGPPQTGTAFIYQARSIVSFAELACVLPMTCPAVLGRAAGYYMANT